MAAEVLCVLVLVGEGVLDSSHVALLLVELYMTTEMWGDM